MATVVRPSGYGSGSGTMTLNELVEKWNKMSLAAQANNYVRHKKNLNAYLSPEQKKKVINYINSKKEQNKTVKPFTGIGRRLNKINRTTLKEQLLNTYLTFTYEMGPGMEKKLFWRYVLLLLYSYSQIYGGNMNMFVEQYYPKTNTMNGLVSEQIQEKWADVFMKLLNKMDSPEGRQILTNIQKNISNNIK